MITIDFTYKTLLCSLLFVCGLGLSKSIAQDEVIFYVDTLGFTIDDVDSELYTFPIKVLNFDSVSGVDITLKVIGDSISMVDLSINPSIPSGLSSFFVQNDSIANGLYISADAFDAIPDDTTFLNLQVRISGGQGFCGQIVFDYLEVALAGAIIPSLGVTSEGLCVISTAQIAGEVVYANSSMAPVDSVFISVVGVDSTFDAITDTNGNFTFVDIPALKAYGIYALSKTDETTRAARLQGINVGDIITIIRHDIGIEPFTSPYQYIAADVNNDGQVSLLDIVLLRDYLLFYTDEFSGNTYWRFIDADFQFQDPDNPFMEPFPEFINIDNLTGDQTGLQFKAIKVGDADLNAY